jgi:conjugative transfer signal peptidase TraF
MGAKFTAHVLIAMSVGLGALATKPLVNPNPVIIWNASDSVPVGWYWVLKRQPKHREIAVMKPDRWVQIYAATRGYLPWNAWLLKPVAAVHPSLICRFGQTLLIDGIVVAKAKTMDARHRFLPVWKGCQRLLPTQYFVISRNPHSFDSRYFGPIERSQVLGTAVPFSDLLK